MKWLGSITDSMDMNHEFEQTERIGKSGVL